MIIVGFSTMQGTGGITFMPSRNVYESKGIYNPQVNAMELDGDSDHYLGTNRNYKFEACD